MHVLLDILVTVVAYALAWFIVISGKVLPLDEGVLKPQVYFMALIFIVPIYLILYASFHLYVPKRIQGRRSELANICKANVIGLMVFTFVLFGLRRFVSHLSYFSTKMTIDNLALFSHLKGMDPQYNFKGETDYSYTPNKTYSFGVEINF